MELLGNAAVTALRLIVSGDPLVYSAVRVTLAVTLASTLLAACAGLPLGYLVATTRFRGRGIAASALHALMSTPTVAIGLLVYAAFSRAGPLGELGWLYTRKAIIVGQFLLALPLVAGLSLSATEALDPRVAETARTLGGGPVRVFLACLHENRYVYAATLVAAFGRVVSEVGISMMAGGNIFGQTRTMTTAIALETSRGRFEAGLALAMILVAIAFAIAVGVDLLRRRRTPDARVV